MAGMALQPSGHVLIGPLARSYHPRASRGRWSAFLSWLGALLGKGGDRH
jgi:hypothetical protein